jgi:hypothetical protein
MTNITDIGQLIDMGIVNFIEYMEHISFSEVISSLKMLEMELGRVSILKDNIYKGMERAIENTDSIEHDKLNSKFIQTYVVEQKIKDRIDLAKYYARRKGVL